MIGFLDPPPSAGSPCRRRCSSRRRDRRLGFLRGIGAVGLTNTSEGRRRAFMDNRLAELAVFTNARHDDQVDSTAQFLAWVKRGSPTTVEDWAERGIGRLRGGNGRRLAARRSAPTGRRRRSGGGGASGSVVRPGSRRWTLIRRFAPPSPEGEKGFPAWITVNLGFR